MTTQISQDVFLPCKQRDPHHSILRWSYLHDKMYKNQQEFQERLQPLLRMLRKYQSSSTFFLYLVHIFSYVFTSASSPSSSDYFKYTVCSNMQYHMKVNIVFKVFHDAKDLLNHLCVNFFPGTCCARRPALFLITYSQWRSEVDYQ